MKGNTVNYEGVDGGSSCLCVGGSAGSSTYEILEDIKISDNYLFQRNNTVDIGI